MSLTYARAAAFVHARLWMAVVAACLVWATWLGSVLLGDGELDILDHPVSVDHLAFYSPARMIREGRSSEIYNHDALFEYQRSLFAPGQWEAFEAFRNPPFYALLYYPTAALPYGASAWLWNLIGLGCLLLGIWLLGAERPLVAAGWSLTFVPVFSTLNFGQNTLLSFAVLCATYRLLIGRRPFLAGLVSGLLWFKPPLLIGLIVWGLLDLRRLWPAAVGVILTGATLTSASYLVVPDAWAGFRQTLESNVEFANFQWWKMHNPRSFWRLLLPDTGTLQVVLWGLTAAAGLWAFVTVWRRQSGNLAAIFGAAVLLTLWVSPHTMIYEWSLALVPAVLWWTYLPQHRTAWLVLFAVAWLALFIGTDWGRVLELVQKSWLAIDPPVILQISVPVLGWAGWRAARLLTANEFVRGSYGYQNAVGMMRNNSTP